MQCEKPKHIFIYEGLNGKKKVNFHPQNGILLGEYDVRCGQCPACQMDHSLIWSNRLIAECSFWPPDSCYMITLTYRNDPVSLVKSDVQRFLKSLRKRYERQGLSIKYYAVGEYGGKSWRPHYHIIVYGCKFDDLDIFKITEYGAVYVSKDIEALWGLGFITIVSSSAQSISYVARYCNKKKGRSPVAKKVIKRYGLIPEFSLISKGLGKRYIEENLDTLVASCGSFFSNGANRNLGCYFTKYLDNNHMEDKSLSIKTKKANLAVNALTAECVSNMDFDLMRLSKVKSKNFNDKIKLLKRDHI